MKIPVKRYANVVAVSGGVDSVYLLLRTMKGNSPTIAAHYNHRARGKDSEEDERFVETLCRKYRMHLEVGGPPVGSRHSAGGKDENGHRGGFEARAREGRYRFLFKTKERYGAKKILVAHTADDQVETILMRIMEGAGISGLKGIPRTREDGIERPLLDAWREDILGYLKKHAIPYREDKSNRDTRIERNWVRHVLLPLLEKRYGKAVKRRIFTLGERFRELDTYVEKNAYNWLKDNSNFCGNYPAEELPRVARYEPGPGKDRAGQGRVQTDDSPAYPRGRRVVEIPRKDYAGLPSVLRIRILQILCFKHLGKAPNERLLVSMDRAIVSGGPSARLDIALGATLRCRYGVAILSSTIREIPHREIGARTDKAGMRRGRQVRTGEMGRGQAGEKRAGGEPVVRMDGPGVYRWLGDDPANSDFAGLAPRFPQTFRWEEKGRTATGRIRRFAQDARWAVFDGEKLPSPLSVRGLRAGDRIRPFGLDADKKVKEILIDRKVPREERWGRAVVCDAEGKILWIPGVLRSAHAPVTPETRRTVVLRAEIPGKSPRRKDGLHRGSSMLN